MMLKTNIKLVQQLKIYKYENSTFFVNSVLHEIKYAEKSLLKKL